MARKPHKRIAYELENFQNVADIVLVTNPFARISHKSIDTIVEKMIDMATGVWLPETTAKGFGGWELRPLRKGKTLFIRASASEYILMDHLKLKRRDSEEKLVVVKCRA